ncbi:MAG: alkaline phosphatase D family protein [Pirellulales bacterium]
MKIQFVQYSLLTLLTAAAFFIAKPAAADTEDDLHITHGPILGRVRPHGIGVWARTSRDTQFAVRYGTAADKLDKVSPPVKTRLENDNTGWVDLTGLKANTRYYYDVFIPGQLPRSGRSGSFRTLPDSKDYVSKELNPRGLFNFKFEFACGNNQNVAHSIGPSLPTFRTMLDRIKDDLNFAILNGDWLYESQRDYKPSQWLAQVDRRAADVPHVVRVAPTIVGVWQNYKHFLSQGQNLAEWHRNVPTFFTYDDHECLNDIWGAGSPGLRDRRAVFRDIGVRAWHDYLAWSNPTTFKQRVHFGRGKCVAGNKVISDADADFTKLNLADHNNLHIHWGTKTAGVNDNDLDGVGGHPNAGVYAITKVLDKNRIQLSHATKTDGEVSYSIGRRSYYKMRMSNCDFFVLDTRGQRQMHDTKNPYKKGLSHLGPVQRDWLIDGVTGSDADFIFVVSSVNFMVPHVGGGKIRGTNKDDAWTVFFDERERLIETFDKLKKPVFVLTGDLHNSFAIKITDNVWEMASGPHNSNNHWASDEGARPANGKFKYGPREVDIRWSTYYRTDIPRAELLHPTYCVVQVNNVFNNPQQVGGTRWVAFPRPQVIFQYYDGRTGSLRYAESIVADSR